MEIFKEIKKMDVPGLDNGLNIERVLDLEANKKLGCIYENTFTFLT